MTLAGRKPSGERSLASRKSWVSMVDIAHEALLEAILDGDSQPGSSLEIRDIADRLAMSPTPVREALAKLATQGLTVLDVKVVSLAATCPAEHREVTATAW
jgi:DNA-binding GntR family transcriptional regulator